MGCCGDASGWANIGLLCVVCALGLQTTGYVTNNWMVYNTIQDQVDVRGGLQTAQPTFLVILSLHLHLINLVSIFKIATF
jgi:hypothetical protein